MRAMDEYSQFFTSTTNKLNLTVLTKLQFSVPPFFCGRNNLINAADMNFIFENERIEFDTRRFPSEGYLIKELKDVPSTHELFILDLFLFHFC